MDKGADYADYCGAGVAYKLAEQLIDDKTLLNKLYNNVNQYPISEEYKTDIYYATNKLAGVISVLGLPFSPDMSNTIQMWKNFSQDENVFNDVRAGFEVGEALSKNVI